MNVATQIAELKRRLDNMLRIGTIESVNGAFCCVKSGNIITDERPFFTTRAGTAKTSWRPSIGEQVMLLSLSGDLDNAYVLPALYSDANPEPNDHFTTDKTIYPDGAVIEYNPETSALSVTGIKTAIVQASEKVTIDCPSVQFTGNVTIDGKANIKQGADIQGSINHQGAMSNKGGVTIDGINFGTHKHSGITPGNGVTGAPQ